jgi:magnesium chelatase family protein
VVGRLPTGLIRRPPFQAPHHTATLAALVGGGAGGQVRPGQVTLAHGGVLFLDEAPEFSSSCLEALRQPLESGRVCISRSGFTTELPSRFQMVIAANPCPCGNATGNGRDCRCSSLDRRRYERRLSGPLLDRVDIHLRVHAPQIDRWSSSGGSTSAESRCRVVAARDRSRARCRRLGMPAVLNSAIPTGMLRRELAPEAPAAELLGESVKRGALSARAADRAIRVGWTIADCSGVDRPGLQQVGQALALRGMQGR